MKNEYGDWFMLFKRREITKGRRLTSFVEHLVEHDLIQITALEVVHHTAHQQSILV